MQDAGLRLGHLGQRDEMFALMQAAIKAGVPVEVPAETINRVCGSGLQAVRTAQTASSRAVQRSLPSPGSVGRPRRGKNRLMAWRS